MKKEYPHIACRMAFVLSCLSPLSGAWAQNGFDVPGLQTGMKVEQAEAALARIWPGMQKEAVNANSGAPLGFRYTNTNAADPAGRPGKAQAVLGIARDGRIWFVGLARHFDAGERPDYATLQKFLLDKFGPPSRPGPALPPAKYLRIKYGMLWSFDVQGRPVPAVGYALEKDPCFDVYGGDNYAQIADAQIIVPRATGVRCGTAIAANVGFDAETRRVAAFSLTVVDATLFYSDAMSGAESRLKP